MVCQFMAINNMPVIKMKNAYIVRDLFLISALFVFPLMKEVYSLFSYIDELVFMLMLSIVLIRVVAVRYYFGSIDIVISFYVIYSVFSVIYNNLPSSSYVQIFITSKFIIIYLYFNSAPIDYKASLFRSLLKYVFLIFFISVILSVFQLIFPAELNSYSHDGRGLFGVAVGGIFWSRILFPEFLLLIIIISMCLKQYSVFLARVAYEYRYQIMLVSLVLIALSFSRKEIAVALLLLPILLQDKFNYESKGLGYSMIALFIGIAFIAGVIVFEEINTRTFTGEQVRYLILTKAVDILEYYAPFGSGPGTFGSIMSLQYTDVYEQFDVTRRLVGSVSDRGPIFDLYLISMIAEYGVGIMFVFAIIAMMFLQKSNILLLEILDVRKLKIAFFIVLALISIFVPILLNWVGFLMFMVLAIVTDKRRVYVGS